MKTLYTHSKTLSGYLMALAMVMFIYSVNAQTNHDVIIVGNSFVPADLAITVGDQVTFTNEAGGGNHNVNGTIATFSGNPESFSNPEGVVDAFVYVWTCNTAGLYDYQCDPHAGGGMVGTITAAVAPCENAALYPANAITVVGLDVITISTCNYEEEHSVITGIQAGGSYEFTADGPTTYITIRQGSVGGTVLAEGFSPLTGVAATADDIYVHWNADASCGTASNCMTTTVQDVSPPCENTNMYPGSALDVSLGTGVQTIAGDVYAGDYSVVTGLTTGNYYQVNVTGGTWITVREGAVAGTVLAAGVGAVAFTSAAGADVYIHYNTEAITCGEATGVELVATIEEFDAAPCENTSLYGSATASAVDGETVVITAFAYVGSEYSIVDGIQNGYEYEVSHEAGSYITVRSGAVGGPVLASGYSPLQFAGGASATVYIHFTADDACTQDATGSWTTEITSLGFSPCENAFQWPAAAVTPDAGGAVTEIDDDQYDSGEYSIITGIVDATNYQFTHSNGAFITVREGAVDGPVVGSGVSPLDVTTSSTSDLYVHWNEDIACNVAGVAYGYITTVQLLIGCTAEAGTLTADASPVCLVGGSADISATEADAPVVPAGYTTLYVLTQGAGLVIINASATPAFTVTAADDYTIHTLVYDPTSVDPTTFIGATGFDVDAALVQGGGVICGALDVTGAPVTVDVCIGMQETLDAGLSIYPNPSSGNFLVTVNGVDARIVLNVTDVAGRLVYTEAATISNSYRNELNLDLIDGSYLLSIVTEEGTVVRRIQVVK